MPSARAEVFLSRADRNQLRLKLRSTLWHDPPTPSPSGTTLNVPLHLTLNEDKTLLVGIHQVMHYTPLLLVVNF